MKFDVVVVGAGTAGCLAAKRASEANLKVCLVERKSRESIGEKICGDALGEHHLNALGLKPPGEVLDRKIEGVKIYSPDMKTVFTVRHEDFSGYLLNRHLFGQWLLNSALDRGAVLMDSTQCLEPIVENGFVKGIMAKKIKTDSKVRIEGKVVVDASGFLAVVRRKLPEEMGIQREISNEDVEACYREIRQIKQAETEKNYCEIYLNQKIAPGGYTWIFHKASGKVNVGLGVCMRQGFPNPKEQLYRHVLSMPLFEGSLPLDRGLWYDPTRRPLDNMVGNGVVIVGDAACLVNPIHGGGIGPSMLSGYLAGEAVSKALENGTPSCEALWPYNINYMKLYGRKQAGLDVFRLLLLTCKDEDLNYGMKYELLTEEDVLKAGLGEEFHLKITEAAKRIFRGLGKIRFLNKLNAAVKMMERVREHYKNYPESPEGFPKWRLKTEELFKEAKLKLSE